MAKPILPDWLTQVAPTGCGPLLLLPGSCRYALGPLESISQAGNIMGFKGDFGEQGVNSPVRWGFPC